FVSSMNWLSHIYPSSVHLERNVLRVDLLLRIIRHLSSLRPCSLLLRRRRGSAAASTSTGTWTELHPVGNDLGTVLLCAVRVPASCLQPSFDERTCTLLEVLRACLRLTAEHHDVVIIGCLLTLSVAVVIDTIG